MSRSVRVFLLAGCGLVAALEARQAGRSLGDGLAGAYPVDPASSVLAGVRPQMGPVPPLPVLMLLGIGAEPIAGWSSGESR